MQAMLLLLLTISYIGWLSMRWAAENRDIRQHQRRLRQDMRFDDPPHYRRAREAKAPMIRLYIAFNVLEVIIALLWLVSAPSFNLFLWLLLLWLPIFAYQFSSLHNYLTFWQPFEILALQREWTMPRNRIYQVGDDGELAVKQAIGRVSQPVRYELRGDGELVEVRGPQREQGQRGDRL